MLSSVFKCIQKHEVTKWNVSACSKEYLRAMPLCDLKEGFKTAMVVNFLWVKCIHFCKRQIIPFGIVTTTRINNNKRVKRSIPQDKQILHKNIYLKEN